MRLQGSSSDTITSLPLHAQPQSKTARAGRSARSCREREIPAADGVDPLILMINIVCIVDVAEIAVVVVDGRGSSSHVLSRFSRKRKRGPKQMMTVWLI